MELLDAAVLDSEHAFFLPTTLAAAAIILVYPEARLLLPDVFHRLTLTPALIFLSRFVGMPFRAVGLPERPYYRVHSMPNKFSDKHTHHPAALDAVVNLIAHPVRFSYMLSTKLVCEWNQAFFGQIPSETEMAVPFVQRAFAY
jgi:hypothetical protein